MNNFKNVSLILAINFIMPFMMGAMDYQDTSALDLPDSDSSCQMVDIIEKVKPISHIPEIFQIPKILGIIISQLTYSIGTKDFINKKDIAVIIRKVYNFARVNKQLYANINSYVITNLLMTSLAKRFEMPLVEAAVLIKNKAAQEWLKQYVHESSDYELFKVVQHIFTICREISSQIKQQTGTSIDDGQKGWPGSNSFYCQTKQGLMLKAENHPDSLFTPWGEVKLFGGGCGSSLGFLAAQQEFLKRITAYFETISESMLDRDKVKHYELIKPIDLNKIQELGFDDVFRQISKEEIASKKDQQVMIVSSYCGFSTIYKIRAGSSTLLPDPEMLPREEYGSSEAIKAIWKIMDNEFHGKTEQQESSPSYSYSQEKEEPRIYPTPYQVIPAIEITNINDIPEKYMQLAYKVANQPLFTGKGYIAKQSKVITCENYGDCRIMKLLIANANKLLSIETQWHLHDFGGENNQLYFRDQCLGYGLSLWIYENIIPCPIETLKNNFILVLNKLKDGWRQSTLIENQDILHTESEEDWFLFIKTAEERSEEDTLIQFLASKFKLDKKINCQSNWHNRENHKNEMYLWVRKDAINEVRAILDLHI